MSAFSRHGNLDGGNLALLRAQTRAAHDSIEHVPALQRLMAPDLTDAEYVAVLSSMYAFHAGIEPLIEAGLKGHPAACLLDGARIAALEDDLAWFGAAPATVRPDLPDLAGAAAMLGALYVIEGSGMGGRVIARHVADSLGVAPGRGGCFYGGLTAEMARRRWAILCAGINAPLMGVASGPQKTAPDTGPDTGPDAGPDTGPDTDFDAALVAGACATFQCLEHWMRQIDITTSRRPAAALSIAPVAP